MLIRSGNIDHFSPHEPITTQNVLFPIIYSRPETSFSWFLNPWKAFRYVVCRYYRWRIICCIVCLLLLVLGGCAIYAFPGYMVKRLLGAWIVGEKENEIIEDISIGRSIAAGLLVNQELWYGWNIDSDYSTTKPVLYFNTD